jgi:hypothetical protein
VGFELTKARTRVDSADFSEIFRAERTRERREADSNPPRPFRIQEEE